MSKQALSVFFSLNDTSEETVNAFVEDMNTMIGTIDGIESFAAGVDDESATGDVNDHNYDAAMSMVFESQEAYKAYQSNETHMAFIEKNKDLWAGVRVFDTVVK